MEPQGYKCSFLNNSFCRHRTQEFVEANSEESSLGNFCPVNGLRISQSYLKTESPFYPKLLSSQTSMEPHLFLLTLFFILHRNFPSIELVCWLLSWCLYPRRSRRTLQWEWFKTISSRMGSMINEMQSMQISGTQWLGNYEDFTAGDLRKYHSRG